MLRVSSTIGVVISGLLLVIFSQCSGVQKETSDKETRDQGFQVTVSILPQAYFVKRIAGDKASINVMIPPGHSPATYAPTPRQMRTLSISHLYFGVGHIPFEQTWIHKISINNPALKIVDTSVGVSLIDTAAIEVPRGHHEHAPGDGHDHSGIDPHIWLSPVAVKIQAKHILDAFIALDTANREIYQKNYNSFMADIDQLHEELTETLKPLLGRRFMVFHPSWGYLGRDYGLTQLSIEVEGKTPSPADLKRVIDIARVEKIKVIFVQQQFDTHNAEAIAAEIGGKVVRLDPLAPDWLQNMKKIADSLKELLK
jgi:zinc transport system substrate-binding protein